MEKFGFQWVRPAERKINTTQTSGMIREEAIVGEQLWTGIARTQPGMMSGWHHHGDWATIAYVIVGKVHLEFGPDGQEMIDGESGDYLFIPKGQIHRESNPTDGEQALVIVRMGSGPVVINVDGPASA